jgi:cobalamin biosynthesis protein CobW
MHTVAVDILTGFLGSGKTTLLRHVLDHGLRGKPVAVIMNEIGEVGIDGRVVTGLSAVEKMVELSSGCICCTIDDYRFDLAVQEIIETTRPHLIIIESTGLADPEPVVDRVKGAGLGLDAIITVVDALDGPRHLRETQVATLQIEAADFLVLNKLDLVDEPAVEQLDRRLGRLNGRAERFRTVRGAIDSDVLFATGVAAFRERARQPGASHPTHLHDEGFASFVYRSPGLLDQGRFERMIGRLPRDVVRAKGIVRFAGRDWQCLFSVICGRPELTWVKLPAVTENQAVFIGRHLARHEEAIRAQLAACETAPDGSQERRQTHG